MPSKKNKVALFLDDEEVTKLEELKKEYGEQNSEVIVRLMNATEDVSLLSPESLLSSNEVENRLTELENCAREDTTRLTDGCKKFEKLEEEISYLQYEIDKLRRRSETEAVEYFSDEEIASYVGSRPETVREWRLGYRKPRGTNICGRLNEFVIDIGRWRRKG